VRLSCGIVATWEELRAVLADLLENPDHPLLAFPGPHVHDVPPPYRIQLEAWAVDIAAELHRRFGSDVDLTVGGLRYPDGQPAWSGQRRPKAVDYPLLPSDRLSISLDEPIVVASGITSRSNLRVHNHQDSTELVFTNGQITARVVDPRTGKVIGGYFGAQKLPGVTFEIAPRQSRTIPLLVGTASTNRDLGFAIPPGEWSFDAILSLQSVQYRTPPMPITITY
jgi:hypothetical protein